jgi:drug/metabolite transporter (DMT)-like permease
MSSRPILTNISVPAAPAPQRSIAAGVAFAAIGAIAFSGKAIIVKLAYRYDVDAVTVIMYRMLFALPLFVAMAWWAGRGQSRLTRRDWLGVIGLGFSGYYLSSMLDFMGLQYITASLERLILYLSPTVVMLFGWRLRGRRITLLHLLATAISYTGTLLVFGIELRGHGAALGGATALGAALVLLSAVSYALYLFYSGDLVQRLGSMRLTGLATTVACLCCIVQFLLLKPLSAALVAPPVIGLSVLNAIGCTAVPVLLVMMGIERLGPSLTAQIGMIGPLATIGMGVVLLGEPFTLWIAAGTVLVVLGIFLFSRAGR